MFDLWRPDRNREVSSKQEMHKKEHDVHSKLQEFYVGNQVLAKNFLDGDKWIPGVVVERTGPLSYIVQIQTGALWRRHVDQLRDGSEVKEGNWNKSHQDTYIPSSSGKQSEAVQVPAQPCKQSEAVQVPAPPCKQSEAVQMSAPPCNQSEKVSIVPTPEPEVKEQYLPSSSTTLDRSEASRPVPDTARRYPQRNRRPPLRF